MKWAQVSAEGVYTSPPKAQLSYGALISGRVGMIRDSSDFAKVALTIAIRYSSIRKQFPKDEKKGKCYRSHTYVTSVRWSRTKHYQLSNSPVSLDAYFGSLLCLSFHKRKNEPAVRRYDQRSREEGLK